MFNILPLVLILLALTVIIVIIGRKFSVLANLDVDSIPAEREAKVKEQIIGNRLKRNFFLYQAKALRVVRPLWSGLLDLVKNSYAKILEFKENYSKEQAGPAQGESKSEIETLFERAEEQLSQDDLEGAEEQYISIISLDSKNIRAFRSLGDLFFKQKKYQEAKQTAEHAVRLLEKESEEAERQPEGDSQEAGQARLSDINKQLAELFYDIAVCSQYLDNIGEGLKSINQALAIEPNNPRFLDTKLDLSIIKEDKNLAAETLEKLAGANPENQKLDELRKKVNELI